MSLFFSMIRGSFKQIVFLLILLVLPVTLDTGEGSVSKGKGVKVLWELRSPRPGEAFLVMVISNKEVDALKGTIFSTRLVFYTNGDKGVYYGIGSIGLGTKPGRYPLRLNLHYKDGTEEDVDSFLLVKDREFSVQRLSIDEGYVHLTPDNLKRVEREQQNLKKIFNTITPEKLFNDNFGMPLVQNVPSTRFGVRRFINGEKRKPHTGLDLKGRLGTPVHACNTGMVVLVKELFFMGKTIIIDHGLGIYSLYAHLSQALVTEGEIVRKGKLIGHVGATGRVTGPHLHWALKIGDTAVDPVSLLELNLR